MCCQLGIRWFMEKGLQGCGARSIEARRAPTGSRIASRLQQHGEGMAKKAWHGMDGASRDRISAAEYALALIGRVQAVWGGERGGVSGEGRWVAGKQALFLCVTHPCPPVSAALAGGRSYPVTRCGLQPRQPPRIDQPQPSPSTAVSLELPSVCHPSLSAGCPCRAECHPSSLTSPVSQVVNHPDLASTETR